MSPKRRRIIYVSGCVPQLENYTKQGRVSYTKTGARKSPQRCSNMHKWRLEVVFPAVYPSCPSRCGAGVASTALNLWIAFYEITGLVQLQPTFQTSVSDHNFTSIKCTLARALPAEKKAVVQCIIWRQTLAGWIPDRLKTSALVHYINLSTTFDSSNRKNMQHVVLSVFSLLV